MTEEKEIRELDNPEAAEDEEDPDAPMFIERKRSLLFALPISLTKYTVTPSVVTTDRGLFNITEDDCYIYKINDVKMTRSFLERLTGLGTVCCYTSDNTSPTLKLEHVQHARELKAYILKQSEAARIRRRTGVYQDITAKGVDVNGNGIPDFLEH